MTLTIGPGAWVRGLNASAELLVQGRLECLGTAGEPIVMTSFDDTSATLWDGVTNARTRPDCCSGRASGGRRRERVRGSIERVRRERTGCRARRLRDLRHRYHWRLWSQLELGGLLLHDFPQLRLRCDRLRVLRGGIERLDPLEDCQFQDNMGQVPVFSRDRCRTSPAALSRATRSRIRIASGSTAVDGAMEDIRGWMAGSSTQGICWCRPGRC